MPCIFIDLQNKSFPACPSVPETFWCNQNSKRTTLSLGRNRAVLYFERKISSFEHMSLRNAMYFHRPAEQKFSSMPVSSRNVLVQSELKTDHFEPWEKSCSAVF